MGRKVNFYVFRHGQTDMNVAQLWQGSQSDCLLNEVGKKQAEELGKKVRNNLISRIYCSSLLRAVQTANIVAKNNAVKSLVTILPDLRECDFGDFEGKPHKEIESKHGELVNNLLWPTKENWDTRFPNGESKKEVFERVYKCLKYIVSCEKFMLGNVGIVCHAGVLSSLACGLGLENISYDNCSVLHLVYDYEKDEFLHVKE